RWYWSWCGRRNRRAGWSGSSRNRRGGWRIGRDRQDGSTDGEDQEKKTETNDSLPHSPTSQRVKLGGGFWESGKEIHPPNFNGMTTSRNRIFASPVPDRDSRARLRSLHVSAAECASAT